jgi:hypothetical protein
MKRILLTFALSAFAGVASAQQLGGSDLGQTAPTPGAADAAQLLTTGDTSQMPDGAMNNFWDNTSGGTGYIGSSFSTGANAAGYTMASLALKFGGGTSGNPGYCGGADVTLDPGYVITIYKLSGTGFTTATGVYTNTVGTLAGTVNTGGDWLQFTGFNLAVQPNSVYAWTIFQPSGYDDMAWASGDPYTGGAICRIPPGGGTVTYTTYPDSATFDVGLTLGPPPLPPLGGTDLGQTAPTPGASDAYQLLQTTSQVLPDSGGLNNFYDNTGAGSHTGSVGNVGSSFTTGANSGGYSMTSLAIKFGGSPPGYAGGADITLDPGWTITIFQLSGTGFTNATGVYTNTVGTLAGTANTGGDWIQITGFNISLQPGSVYAWTILSSGWDDLGYYAGSPQYTGGAICEIPPSGGTVTYYPADADSATFDVGLTPIKGQLGGIDLGQTAPVPGPADAFQEQQTTSQVLPDGGGLNNFYDNTAPGSHSNSVGNVGSSFSTGANSSGYALNSLAIKFGGSPPGYAGGADTTLDPGWTITIFQLSGTGFTNATGVYTNTVGTLAGTANTGGDWIQITGFSPPFMPTLLPSTAYAWTIFSTGYDDLGYYAGSPQYTGGAICEIPPGGGTVTYYPADADSATFDVGMTLEGFPIAGAPTATPNPCYALSPITLTETASGPGVLTYQWQTNSDLTGGQGGTWASIPGATNLTLTFTPSNSDSGTLDFQFVVSNSAGATTSGVVALVVNPSQAPASSTGVVPSAVTTYAGATVSFSDTNFVGTTPITYQWQVNTGSGYTNIPSSQNPSATNTTLNLTNVQLSGTYQLVAMNSQGTVNDSSVQVGTLTLLTPPAPPTSSSPQNVPYVELADGPWAYWRLQETANPQAAPPTVFAYDYSGHGFFATYGDEMTDDVAGPQPPVYPGFSSNELSVQPYSALPNGYLSVPPLNLTTNTVSFVAWINPSGPQSTSTGLFFNRNGGDAAGFGFNGGLNPNGDKMPCLGFTWNSNASATWGWNSHLFPVVGDWSLVAYVITPTNETTYLYYVDTTVSPHTTNYLQSSINLANIVETFSTNTIYLGADTQQTSTRTFNGSMAEVALYQRALSQNDVQTIFLTAINSTTAPATAPTALPVVSLFAGESFTFNGTAGGTAPIYYQWKSSTDDSTWTNVPSGQNYSDPTQATLTINDATSNNALYYEVVASNSIATSTSGPGQITAVTPVPTGQWTVNFQLTNDTLNFATSASGGGQYTGPGVLGSGTYWNSFVNTLGAFATGTFSTATDLESDGATHSGIYASIGGQDDSTLNSPAPSSSIATLLDQFVYSPTTLTFTGVPDGTYNLMIYGVDGGFANKNDSINVAATNGTQTGTLQNTTDAFFAPGNNSAVFTNVQVAGGTLAVAFGSAGAFNGAQLQLVSYASTVGDQPLSAAVSGNTLTLTWTEGVLQTTTNLAGAWVDIADPSPVTVTMTNSQQFFRLRGPAE